MVPVSKEALQVHEAYPPIDLHADTLLWSRWLNYDMHRFHEPPFPKAALGGHVDLPRMHEGGMSAQFFGLVGLPVLGNTKGCKAAIHEQIDALQVNIEQNPSALELARSAEDIERCQKEGKIAALLGLEGAHSLEGDLNELYKLKNRGLKYLGLLHFSANEVGAPAYGRGQDSRRGLSSWGRDLIALCEDLNVMVDLAHINLKGFMEACEFVQKPPMVSHTGVLGAFEHWRNIDDRQLKAVANKGGCIGVIFCPQFLGAEGIDGVVKHLLHILNTVGEDAPALGSDWDGFIVPTRGLEDPRGLPKLTEALLRAGVSHEVVAKILRNNVLRVLKESGES